MQASKVCQPETSQRGPRFTDCNPHLLNYVGYATELSISLYFSLHTKKSDISANEINGLSSRQVKLISNRQKLGEQDIYFLTKNIDISFNKFSILPFCV